MSLRGSQSDPYTESGGFASLREVRRMRRSRLESAVEDADALQQRGLQVIRRGTVSSRFALVAMALCAGGVVALGHVAATSFDGTYAGTARANWSMLGVVVAGGALNFAWGWFNSRRRLRETGKRLIRRAEYRRKLTALQFTEAENEALR